MLHDVRYAPEIRRNLIYVLVFLELRYHLTFYGVCLEIFLNSVLIGTGHLINGFIVLDTILYDSSYDNSCFSYVTSFSNNEIDVITWHARLSHLRQERMYRLARKGMLGPLTKIKLPICENCLVGKTTRKPFSKRINAEKLLQLIHSDMCDPMNIKVKHEASYFITFIDDYSRFGHVYLISHKSEVLDCFKLYLNMVDNQLDINVKALKTDRGCEYLSKQFKELYNEKGIKKQLTIPETPQQNSIAERRNRTLWELVRSMIAQANLPISYWGDDLLIVAYALNRVPSKLVSSTPYKL